MKFLMACIMVDEDFSRLQAEIAALNESLRQFTQIELQQVDDWQRFDFLYINIVLLDCNAFSNWKQIARYVMHGKYGFLMVYIEPPVNHECRREYNQFIISRHAGFNTTPCVRVEPTADWLTDLKQKIIDHCIETMFNYEVARFGAGGSMTMNAASIAAIVQSLWGLMSDDLRSRIRRNEVVARYHFAPTH